MPPIDPISTAVQGAGVIGNMLGSIWQNSANARLAEKTREHQTALFREGNAFSEYMMDKANLYNSPIQQRERMAAAGINPLSEYGVAQSATASSIGIPAMPTASMMNPLANDPLTLAKGANLLSDSENKNADAEYKESLKATEDALRESKVIIAGKQIDLANKNLQLSDTQIDKISAEINESSQRINESVARVVQGWASLGQNEQRVAIERFRANLDAQVSAKKLQQGERDLALRAIGLQIQDAIAQSTIQTNSALQYLYGANADKANAERERIEGLSLLDMAQARYYDESANYLSSRRTGQDIRNEIDEKYGEKKEKAIVRNLNSSTVRNYGETAASLINGAANAISAASGVGALNPVYEEVFTPTPTSQYNPWTGR